MDNPGSNGSSSNEGEISRSISKSDHSLSDRARACRARRSSTGMAIRGTNEGARLDGVSASNSMNWSSGANEIGSVAKIVDMRWEDFRVGRLPKSSSAVSCLRFCLVGREERRTGGEGENDGGKEAGGGRG